MLDDIKILAKKTNIEYKDYIEAIRLSGKDLIDYDLVDRTYIDELIAREESFPTGLAFSTCSIAIPHSDSKRIKKDALAINVLENPVAFKLMAEEDKESPVNIIIILAIKNKDYHLAYLSRLMEIFQDEKKVSSLIAASSSDIIKEKFKNYLRESAK